MDAEKLLAHPASHPVAEAEVGERRERHADAGHQVGVADEPVADAGAALADDRGAGAVVRLGDEHAVRAGARADPAARAQVDRAVGRCPFDGWSAEALGLRAHVLRPGKGVGDAGDRADRGAHVALDARVGRVLRELARCRVMELMLRRPRAGRATGPRGARWRAPRRRRSVGRGSACRQARSR